MSKTKKYFVVSDVHSFYKEMKEALDDAGFDINNPDHIFVSCGDLFDRGDKARACMGFVLGLPEDRCILIRGNHEDLLDMAVARGYFVPNDYSNGTVGTMKQFYRNINNDRDYISDSDLCIDIKENQYWKMYSRQLRDYYETKNYVFVHGFIPDVEDWRNAHNGNWNRARWKNGMEEIFYNCSWLNDKTIVVGHWHCSWGHMMVDGTSEFGEDAIFEPFYTKGLIAIDACTAHSHKVNCLVIEDEEME